MAAMGYPGSGYYGPPVNPNVSVGGVSVPNSSLVAMTMLGHLGADLDFSMGGAVTRRLTTDFTGITGGAKVGGVISWEDMQQMRLSDGTYMEDADMTPFDSDRFELRLQYHHKVGFDLNAMVRAIHLTDKQVWNRGRASVLRLATQQIRNITGVCVGNFVYQNRSGTGASQVLNNPGARAETNLSSVRDGAQVFSDLITGMRLRGIVGGMETFTGFLNLRHAQSMALETLGAYHPGGVVESLFRDPRAQGRWYGSRIRGMRLVASQQIGTLNGSGAIQLDTSITAGQKQATWKGFGNSQTGVLHARNTVGWKGIFAVDPQDKQTLDELAQFVIVPAATPHAATTRYSAYTETDVTLDSNGSGKVTTLLPRPIHWASSGTNSEKKNVSAQPTANLNMILNGVEISDQNRRSLFANKTQTMSHFYLEGAAQCVTIPVKRIGPGVHTTTMTSQAKKISAMMSTEGDWRSMNERTRFDLGTYGLALDRPDSACRIGGKTSG